MTRIEERIIADSFEDEKRRERNFVLAKPPICAQKTRRDLP